MSNEEWWAGTRKAAEYWHAIRANQIDALGKENALVGSGSQVGSDGLLGKASVAIADSAGSFGVAPSQKNRNTLVKWD
jgi:hypothetical protein